MSAPEGGDFNAILPSFFAKAAARYDGNNGDFKHVSNNCHFKYKEEVLAISQHFMQSIVTFIRRYKEIKKWEEKGMA